MIRLNIQTQYIDEEKKVCIMQFLSLFTYDKKASIITRTVCDDIE